MIPSLKGLPTKAKEAPSPHEVRLAPLDTNPVFHSLRKSWGSSWGSRNSISWRESRGNRTVYLIVLFFIQIIVFQVMFQCVYNAKFFNCFGWIISKSETNFLQDFPSRVILTKSMFKYCKIIFKSSIHCEANLKFYSGNINAF